MSEFVDTPSLLADIEARQDEVLQRLDELDRDILGVLSQHSSPRHAVPQEAVSQEGGQS